MANEDIRKIIKQYRLKYWEVAKEYGLSDTNFSKMLRTPLSNEKKIKKINAIKSLIGQK